MSEAMEAMERAEKVEGAGHGHGTGHGGHSKLIGLTMGLIGVLIALCAASVGGERNEMTRSMIEQTQANADATSASTKFRIIMLDIEHLRADPNAPAMLKERFIRLYSDYLAERKITADWAKSYEPLVEAHFEATEGYERAQLIAEVAIVFASLAILLANNPAWFLSIALALGSIGQMGMTYVRTEHHVEAAQEQIAHQRDAYAELRRQHTGDTSDADAADALDPGGAMRKAIAAALHAAPAAAHAAPAADHGEHK